MRSLYLALALCAFLPACSPPAAPPGTDPAPPPSPGSLASSPSTTRLQAEIAVQRVPGTSVPPETLPPPPPSAGALPPPETEPTVLPDKVLLFSGDVLLHVPVSTSAARHAEGTGYSFAPMFTQIAPVISSADLAICHLEVPLDPESRRISGFPRFSAPAEIAAALSGAGYDGCSTASNHSLDRGATGVLETLDVLDSADLGHAGTARDANAAAGALYDLGDVVIGHTAFTYGFMSSLLPADQPWLVNRLDTDAVLAAATRLRDLGADFTVVSLHWGHEYSQRPSQDQIDLAAQLLASEAIDLIVGHHPHVLQPVAEVDGEFVLYSLGNLLSNQTAGCCGTGAEEGALVLVRLRHHDGTWRAVELAHVPTWVHRRAGHIVTPALGASSLDPRLDARLEGAAANVSTALGPAVPGLSVDGAVDWIRNGTAPPIGCCG